jgi:hypothetical protein
MITVMVESFGSVEMASPRMKELQIDSQGILNIDTMELLDSCVLSSVMVKPKYQFYLYMPKRQSRCVKGN